MPHLPAGTARYEFLWVFHQKMSQAPECLPGTNTIFIKDIKKEENKYQDATTATKELEKEEEEIKIRQSKRDKVERN